MKPKISRLSTSAPVAHAWAMTKRRRRRRSGYQAGRNSGSRNGHLAVVGRDLDGRGFGRGSFGTPLPRSRRAVELGKAGERALKREAQGNAPFAHRAAPVSGTHGGGVDAAERPGGFDGERENIAERAGNLRVGCFAAGEAHPRRSLAAEGDGVIAEAERNLAAEFLD